MNYSTVFEVSICDNLDNDATWKYSRFCHGGDIFFRIVKVDEFIDEGCFIAVSDPRYFDSLTDSVSFSRQILQRLFSQGRREVVRGDFVSFHS